MISSKELREIFDYDAITGNLLWKVRTGRKAIIGTVAGAAISGRYVVIGVKGARFYAHRLVWLWHGRELPQYIDHINCNKHDNRIENLRVASASENQFNHRRKSTNSSGIKGVSWNGRLKKWWVRVHANNHLYSFGPFKDRDLAELVAIEARNKYHGEFARHG